MLSHFSFVDATGIIECQDVIGELKSGVKKWVEQSKKQFRLYSYL